MDKKAAYNHKVFTITIEIYSCGDILALLLISTDGFLL